MRIIRRIPFTRIPIGIRSPEWIALSAVVAASKKRRAERRRAAKAARKEKDPAR